MMLKVLDVDGAVRRVPGGWTVTGEPWTYDAERYRRVSAAREVEQQAMLEYIRTDRCRMSFLREQLDDPAPEAVWALRQLRWPDACRRPPTRGRSPRRKAELAVPGRPGRAERAMAVGDVVARRQTVRPDRGGREGGNRSRGRPAGRDRLGIGASGPAPQRRPGRRGAGTAAARGRAGARWLAAGRRVPAGRRRLHRISGPADAGPASGYRAGQIPLAAAGDHTWTWSTIARRSAAPTPLGGWPPSSTGTGLADPGGGRRQAHPACR